MKDRIISGIIMGVILIVVFLIGEIALEIGAGILAVAAFYELTKVKKEIKIPNIMKIVGVLCMLALIYINNIGERSFIFGLSYETLSLLFVLLLAPTVLLYKKKYSINAAFYLTAITIFLGTVFNLMINLFNQSIYQFIFVILVAACTDIFALVGGKLIGKHKFTPISPNKTIEGCITGTVVATIVATTYYQVFIPGNPVIATVLMVIVLSIIGQLGDLFFSLIKRENGVKDFSDLIPGHGGILDRIDSIIFIIMAFLVMMQF